jgi:predicted transposase/invertase (TIGR01784 family)
VRAAGIKTPPSAEHLFYLSLAPKKEMCAVAELKYKFTRDTLFKLFFVKYPEFLKMLVAVLLRLKIEDIDVFTIKNPDIPPAVLGEKFCRLDINMTVGDRLVDIEVQVADEGDYPERSLYYWARDYSSALPASGKYRELPETIVISIVAFSLFSDCAEFHSEFRPLEVTRHTPLTDKMCLHYFELPKLPEIADGDDTLRLWLALFQAKTEEDLSKITNIGGTIMEQVVEAYRSVSVSDEFKEIERLRELARHNEASAIDHAVRKAVRENKMEMAKGLVEDGMDINIISKRTGLSAEEIRGL